MENIEKCVLWQGDCLELMKNIPDGSVDLTVTSPPYDNLRTYNGNIDQWNFDIAEKRIDEAIKSGARSYKSEKGGETE